MANGPLSADPSFLATKTIDPVQQAVDNYILMERKARAWDDLRAVAIVERWEKVLALMDLKGV